MAGNGSSTTVVPYWWGAMAAFVSAFFFLLGFLLHLVQVRMRALLAVMLLLHAAAIVLRLTALSSTCPCVVPSMRA